MQKIYKSKKITGLERLQELGLKVPSFTFIPDFEILGVSIEELKSPHCNQVILEYVRKAVTELDEIRHGYTVRSASFDEDTSDKSSAGRYLTFNGLKNLNELYNAAVETWIHHRANAPSGVHCPLIIQETHCSYFSGVLFRDPSSEAPISVIESFYGSCRTIVDGQNIPYRSTWANNSWTHELRPETTFCAEFSAHIDLFANSNLPVQAGSILHPCHSPFPTQVRALLDSTEQELQVYGYRPPAPPEWYTEKICKPLIKIAEALDTGEGVDIEWGTSPSGDLYFYQYRVLSRALCFKQPQANYYEGDNHSGSPSSCYKGLPGAPGTAQGRITSNLREVTNDSILMLLHSTIDDVGLIEKCAGVVSARGGMLSHLAIVCRELKKPCVVGIGEIIPGNTGIEINGNTGIVITLA